ncbi:hypothetical protein K1W54_20255 [Micromonospora sp. CPCC 205371]|nr:hypothetical protein [Micromonospora sp. CPCC 205371]
MSEYQYYEFLAVDKALDAAQMDELRGLSTRAHITPTSFVNTYQWGDLRGDPRRLMERYFDAFLYLANWGTRRLMLRLPKRLLDLPTAQQYCPTDIAATAWARNSHVIIELTYDSDDGGDWDDEDGHGILATIISARADLAAGDLRLLYLAWLHAASTGELDDDQVEPPVPANLATLNAPLRSLADFIRLDQDLLAVAARASTRHKAAEAPRAQLASWVQDLPAKEKDGMILRVIRGEDVHLRTELLRRFHGQPAPNAQAGSGRTVADLLDAAQTRRERREREQAQERELARARAERDAAAEHDRRLDALAAEGEHAWVQVTQLIETKKTSEYDVAVGLLRDLHELAWREGEPDTFDKRLRDLRQRYANRPGLLQRINHAGLPAATGRS